MLKTNFRIGYLLCLVFILQFRLRECLVCNRCSSVTNAASCTSTHTCPSTQFCYTDVQGYEGHWNYSLGCETQAECNDMNTVTSPATKMSACHKCCNSTSCNKQLCTTSQELCADDATFNCASSDKLFQICNDVHHAKLVCRKYCHLCNLVDGAWSDWTSWSSCSVTCDDGQMHRRRTCTNPAPKNGGLNCSGSSSSTKSCHIDLPCPVHGGWSSWQSWGVCSVSCGTGLKSRLRTCTNPVPAQKGEYCHGDHHDYSLCSITSCERDGGWSVWGSWGSCSGHCGPGLKVKTRTCTDPTPIGSGKTCGGDAHEYSICFDQCTTTTTTVATITYPPGTCQDKLDNCYMYPKELACKHMSYRAWAMDKCAAYCEFCTPVTLTPVPCIDRLPNCHEYDAGDLCSTPTFSHWVEINCYKYCDLRSCRATPATTSTTVPPPGTFTMEWKSVMDRETNLSTRSAQEWLT